MPEQDLSSEINTPSTESSSPQENSATSDNHVLAKLILEIQQTPEEYLPNLLQIVRLFRESVTMKQVRSHTYAKAMDEIKNPDPVKKSVRQIALRELLRQWEEEREPSKIFRPAFAKMVANLNSRGITNAAINASVTPSGKRPRAGVTEFINLGSRWEIHSLEKYLLSNVVDEEALECFFREALEILKNLKNNQLTNEQDIRVENNADLEDAALGGIQGKKN